MKIKREQSGAMPTASEEKKRTVETRRRQRVQGVAVFEACTGVGFERVTDAQGR